MKQIVFLRWVSPLNFMKLWRKCQIRGSFSLSFFLSVSPPPFFSFSLSFFFSSHFGGQHRQTVLVSATMPAMLIEFARAGLNDPQVSFLFFSFLFFSFLFFLFFSFLFFSFLFFFFSFLFFSFLFFSFLFFSFLFFPPLFFKITKKNP